MNNEMIAMVCHNVNTAFCEAIGDPVSGYWNDCPEWQRESSCSGVNYVVKNPNCTSKEIHEKWCEDKLKNGWVYGEVKDAEKKTHPCLVEYEKLDLNQRIKDKLFITIVKTLISLKRSE